MRGFDFDKALVALQNELHCFAYKLTADKDEAENLLQETMLRTLDNKDKFDSGTNFKGWMYTIMRNIFINNYRRAARSKTLIDTTDDLYHLNLPQNSGYDSPEVAYNVKEISSVINPFSEEYRVPFSMFVAGYKYEEIADKMNIPLGTVKSRIFFARKRLKNILNDFN